MARTKKRFKESVATYIERQLALAKNGERAVNEADILTESINVENLKSMIVQEYWDFWPRSKLVEKEEPFDDEPLESFQECDELGMWLKATAAISEDGVLRVVLNRGQKAKHTKVVDDQILSLRPEQLQDSFRRANLKQDIGSEITEMPGVGSPQRNRLQPLALEDTCSTSSASSQLKRQGSFAPSNFFDSSDRQPVPPPTPSPSKKAKAKPDQQYSVVKAAPPNVAAKKVLPPSKRNCLQQSVQAQVLHSAQLIELFNTFDGINTMKHQAVKAAEGKLDATIASEEILLSGTEPEIQEGMELLRTVRKHHLELHLIEPIVGCYHAVSGDGATFAALQAAALSWQEAIRGARTPVMVIRELANRSYTESKDKALISRYSDFRTVLSSERVPGVITFADAYDNPMLDVQGVIGVQEDVILDACMASLRLGIADNDAARHDFASLVNAMHAADVRGNAEVFVLALLNVGNLVRHTPTEDHIRTSRNTLKASTKLSKAFESTSRGIMIMQEVTDYLDSFSEEQIHNTILNDLDRTTAELGDYTTDMLSWKEQAATKARLLRSTSSRFQTAHTETLKAIDVRFVKVITALQDDSDIKYKNAVIQVLATMESENQAVSVCDPKDRPETCARSAGRLVAMLRDTRQTLRSSSQLALETFLDQQQATACDETTQSRVRFITRMAIMMPLIWPQGNVSVSDENLTEVLSTYLLPQENHYGHWYFETCKVTWEEAKHILLDGVDDYITTLANQLPNQRADALDRGMKYIKSGLPKKLPPVDEALWLKLPDMCTSMRNFRKRLGHLAMRQTVSPRASTPSVGFQRRRSCTSWLRSSVPSGCARRKTLASVGI